MICWNDWGGHWQTIIGYDTMGTENENDDVFLVADSYDTTDHNQDGYGIYPAERLMYNFTMYGAFPESDTLKNVQKRTNEEIFVGPDDRPFILTEGIFDFMIDQYFLVLTTIDLFVLTFMCILTKLSETLNSKQKRGFFLAFVLIGVISILEVITILVDGAPVHLRWLNILSNYLGFGLSPAVSLCLVYVLDKKQGVRRGFKTAVACEAAYLISLALMLPGGMVFSVSEENLYSRGDFFAFYVTAYFAALVYLAACTDITARVFQNRSRVLIYPLIVFLAAETIIQIALPQLHVT